MPLEDFLLEDFLNNFRRLVRLLEPFLLRNPERLLEPLLLRLLDFLPPPELFTTTSELRGTTNWLLETFSTLLWVIGVDVSFTGFIRATLPFTNISVYSASQLASYEPIGLYLGLSVLGLNIFKTLGSLGSCIFTTSSFWGSGPSAVRVYSANNLLR